MRFAASVVQSRAWRWPAVLLWAAVIFWLSATPNLRVASADDIDFVVRKAGHMCAFGVLAFLLWSALASMGFVAGRRGWALILAWILTVAYAASDEFHQSFTAGRHAAASDVAIDAAGALLFLAVVAVWLKWWRGRRFAAGSARGVRAVAKGTAADVSGPAADGNGTAAGGTLEP
ncbi:MAG TPA: VanZ family protein [Candidatus Limnocylindrales bacterium]